MKMKIYHHSGKKTLRENLDKASFPFSLLKYPWHFLSKGKKSTLTPKCLTRILNIFHILQKKSRLCITKLERIKLEPAANPSPEPDIGRHIRSRGKICRVEGGAGAVVTFNTGAKNYPSRKLHDLPVPNFFSSETHWGRNRTPQNDGCFWLSSHLCLNILSMSCAPYGKILGQRLQRCFSD